MRLAAALKIDAIEKERREIWSKLTELESAPTAADTQIDTLYGPLPNARFEATSVC